MKSRNERLIIQVACLDNVAFDFLVGTASLCDVWNIRLSRKRPQATGLSLHGALFSVSKSKDSRLRDALFSGGQVSLSRQRLATISVRLQIEVLNSNNGEFKSFQRLVKKQL